MCGKEINHTTKNSKEKDEWSEGKANRDYSTEKCISLLLYRSAHEVEPNFLIKQPIHPKAREKNLSGKPQNSQEIGYTWNAKY